MATPLRDPAPATGGVRPVADRAAAAIAVAVVLVLAGGALLLGARRPLWYDEIFTLRLSRLGSVADLLDALRGGADLHPPLGYLLARASTSVLGESPLALRLPFVVAFAAATLGLFAFARPRTGTVPALVAALVPAATTASAYATEARSYALVLFFAVTLLLAWRTAVEGRRRTLGLLGMAGSLGAAVSSHYYAALLVLPIVAAEAVRSAGRRRVDPAVWIALAAGLLPLLVWAPLVRAVREFSGAYWAPPAWRAIDPAYAYFVRQGAVPLAVALVVLVFGRTDDPGHRAGPGFPWHELVAAAGFLALPVAALVAGKLATGAFVERYVLATVIGISVLLAEGFARGTRPAARLGVAGLFLAWAFGSCVYERQRAGEELARQTATLDALGRLDPPDAPIAVADSNEFLALHHYAPPAVRERLVYLVDAARAIRHGASDSDERGLTAFGRWVPIPAVPFDEFLAGRRSVLVHGSNGWIVAALLDAGARIEWIGAPGGRPTLRAILLPR